MKKYLWIVALIAALALLFVGCNNNPDEPDPDDPNTGGPNTGGPNTGGPNTGGPNTGGGDETPTGPTPGPTDDSIVEEISLSNGWTAIYKFTLPEGKTWDDYKGLKADYKIADVTTAVRARVFGNFTQAEVDQIKLGEPTIGDTERDIGVVASWPGGSSGEYIFGSNNWAGNTAANTIFGSAASPNPPVNNEWFTVNYPKPGTGTGPHANWNKEGTVGRAPDATTAGPFYIGLGLSTGSKTPAVTSQITNVYLVGYDETVPDILGMPLYFTKGEKKYRAYNGQLDKDDSTGGYTNTQDGEPNWKIISGQDKITFVTYVPLADITVSFNANYPNGDTAPDIDDVSFQPGSRLTDAQLARPAKPTTAPTDGKSGWSFLGWFTAATGGTKITKDTIFQVATEIFAQWESANTAEIAFLNLSGTTKAGEDVVTEGGGGSLTATQLAKPTGAPTAPNADKSFGGWYSVDTTGSTFDYTDYSNLVTTQTTFTTDTDLYAYWYTPGDTKVNGITVVAQGGGRIDADGYVIFVIGGATGTSYLGGGYDGDTLLTFKFPDPGEDFPGDADTMKITYTLKAIVDPVITAQQQTDGWLKDAGFIWKKGYGKWSPDAPVVSGGGSYSQYGGFSEIADSELTKALADFKAEDALVDGVSMQINKGDDTNSKKKRDGYVYGIKITAIEFE